MEKRHRTQLVLGIILIITAVWLILSMPDLLTNGDKTPKQEMRELLNDVKPRTLRERMLKVWDKC